MADSALDSGSIGFSYTLEKETKNLMNRLAPTALIITCLLIALFAFHPEVASANSAGDWPMFQHDLNHSGSSSSYGPTTNQPLWNYTTGGGVTSSPAVVGGVVYVGSGDRNGYALNAGTGAKIWNYTTGWLSSSPAVVGGVVYVGSDDGNVYALNAATGAKLWNYTAGDMVWGSPAVVGGVVYVGSYDGNVYALNATSGTKIWNYATGGPVQSSPAVADGVVYVGSGDHNVYAIGANASAPAQSSPTPVESISAPPTSTSTLTSTPSTTPSPAIPEFPSWMILPLCAVAAFAAVVVVWRKKARNLNFPLGE